MFIYTPKVERKRVTITTTYRKIHVKTVSTYESHFIEKYRKG